MIHFGFSYIGVLYLLMLFIPNGIWTKHQPAGYEDYAKNENKVLLIIERVGQVTTTMLCLFFSDFNPRVSGWIVVLIVSFLCMVLYEIFWIRYFRSPKTMEDYYSSILGIPLAGATLPVIAFFLLGLYGCNMFLMISSVFLGIGHIGIHWNHRKEVTDKKSKLPVRILKWAVAVIAIVIVAVPSYFVACRNVTYIKHMIQAKKGVLESTYVTLGGQEQYILVRGNDTSNPVIIYLHGGPASPDAYDTYMFADGLVDDYTIIAWDQRGCGRSYVKNQKSNPSNEGGSFEQAVEDLDDLVDYACERFGQEKVIIMGWSYGTILGSHYVVEHPEKVSNYIAIGQVVNMQQNEALSMQDAIEQAKAAGDDTTKLTEAYAAYEKDPMNVVNMSTSRALSSAYHPQEYTGNTVVGALYSPYFSWKDFQWFLMQMGDINAFFELNRPLLDVTLGGDIHDCGTDYEVPVYYITGSCDWVCSGSLAEAYLDEITAPEKQMIYMEGCGHSAHYDRPDQFVEIIHSILE